MHAIVAGYWRLLHSLLPIPPDNELEIRAICPYLMIGDFPSPAQVKGIYTYLPNAEYIGPVYTHWPGIN